MTDVFEHNPGDHEDPLPGPTMTIGIVGTVLFVVSVLAVAATFYSRRSAEFEVKVDAQPTLEVETLRAEQLARLDGPLRIEQRLEGEESLVIPIEDAIDRVVQEANEP